MEVLPVLVTRNELILAGVDHLLESGLCRSPILKEYIGLTSNSPSETLGSLYGAVLVRSACALIKIVCSIETLLSNPLEKILVRHRILRILVAVVRDHVSVEHVVNEWRVVPKSGEEEVVVCTEGTSLGNTPLGGSGRTAVWQTVLEVVNYKVAGVN